MILNEFFKASDVAKLMGLSLPTVELMLARKQIPEPVFFGKRKFWPKGEMKKWISSGCKKPVEQTDSNHS